MKWAAQNAVLERADPKEVTLKLTWKMSRQIWQNQRAASHWEGHCAKDHELGKTWTVPGIDEAGVQGEDPWRLINKSFHCDRNFQYACCRQSFKFQSECEMPLFSLGSFSDTKNISLSCLHNLGRLTRFLSFDLRCTHQFGDISTIPFPLSERESLMVFYPVWFYHLTFRKSVTPHSFSSRPPHPHTHLSNRV